jgi:hypothetical protein
MAAGPLTARRSPLAARLSAAAAAAAALLLLAGVGCWRGAG